MPRTRTYFHLSAEERAVIMLKRREGSSLRSIAQSLQRSPATVSRELKRNETSATLPYDATQAARAYRHRRARCRRRSKLAEGTALHRHVYDRLLYRCWSPQQIAARLRCMPADQCPGWVSHETIYAAIYAHPRGAFKQGLIDVLRQSKPTRGRRRISAAAKGFVPEALRIVHRPEEIAQRRCRATGKAISSKVLTTVRRWALSWSARLALSCSAGWAVARPPMPWKDSLGK
jgi:IS30 family transposase